MAKRRKNSKNKGFEKQIEKNAQDFADEISALADKIGIKFEEKNIEKRDGWGFRVFGLVGPLLGSIVSTMFLVFFAWLISLIGVASGVGFFRTFSSLLSSNIYWFFVLFLFFGYNDYFSKRYRKTYWIVSPFISGASAVFVVWIAVWALNSINIYTNTVFVAFLSNFLYSNMMNIMFAFIILNYVLILIEKTMLVKGSKWQ